MDRTANVYKNRSDDRVLTLKTMEGEKPLNTLGATDARLFTGENKLHALKVPGGNMWRLRYESGILPAPLQQTFTSFNKLMDYTTEYFKRRNIEIVGTEDVF